MVLRAVRRRANIVVFEWCKICFTERRWVGRKRAATLLQPARLLCAGQWLQRPALVVAVIGSKIQPDSGTFLPELDLCNNVCNKGNATSTLAYEEKSRMLRKGQVPRFRVISILEQGRSYTNHIHDVIYFVLSNPRTTHRLI